MKTPYLLAAWLSVLALWSCDKSSSGDAGVASPEQAGGTPSASIVGKWFAIRPSAGGGAGDPTESHMLVTYGADGSMIQFDTLYQSGSLKLLYKFSGTWIANGADALILNNAESFTSKDTGKTWRTKSPDGIVHVKYVATTSTLSLYSELEIVTCVRVQ
ncbi:MAG: hypothetical protein IPN71_17620 [Fibrobacteres bacterium]|nr:hypothetical protein [Fibrobacterota bacterium]